jgi:type II secretion system protein C
MLLLLVALATPPLTALGIVVASTPEHSVAILSSGGRTRVVGIGETAFGGKVAAITPQGVSLEYGSDRVLVPLAGGAPPQGAVAQAIPPAGGALTLSRNDLERRLGSEIPRILAETALSPVSDGPVRGVALTRLPEGSLLTDAGLRAGDILTEVNGTRIDSLAALLALYPRLQTETEVRAIVLRNGQPISLSLHLRAAP